MRHYVSKIMKQMFEVCDKNIPNAKNEKLSHLSKMKELIKLFLKRLSKRAPLFIPHNRKLF